MEEKILLQIVSTLENVQKDISDMKGDISNMKGDISNMKGDITNMKGDITNMKGDIANLNTRMDNLENGVYDGFAKITDYIDKSETRIKLFVENQTQKKIGALQDGYQANHEKLNDHREKLNDHEKRISRLEDTARF